MPTAKESTVQPSSSFVMSKYNVKQTKAQVYESNYSVIKPPNSGPQVMADSKMLEEYKSKLFEGKPLKKIQPTSKPQRSESSDNVLTNEFMRVREEKFGKVLEMEKLENEKNLAKSKQNSQFIQQDNLNCLLKEIDGIMGEFLTNKKKLTKKRV